MIENSNEIKMWLAQINLPEIAIFSVKSSFVYFETS